MSESASEQTDPARRGSWKWSLPAALILLLAAGGVLWWIYSTEPVAERTGAVRQSAMLVEVVEAEGGDFRPVIRVLGRVEPTRELVLRPRVDGQVLSVANDFRPGGMVARGDLLIGIDPEDYRIALRQRESDLDQARADLALEEGRQAVAREDFALLEDAVPEDRKSLVLREPQLRTARARVEAAEAAVARAELDLRRTRVEAPFDAQVLDREVDLGSQVAAGDPLGTLVGLETYWIFATVPTKQLPWLRFAGEGEQPSAAVIRNRAAWPEGAVREGRVESLVGGLTEQTRLARVLIEVDDPLGRETAGAPPLLLGSLVEVEITGREIPDVVRLDRDYVRKDDTVWVMEDGELRIRPLQIVFSDAVHAYVAEGLKPGDRVVTTSLATIAEGSPLRLADGNGNANGNAE